MEIKCPDTLNLNSFEELLEAVRQCPEDQAMLLDLSTTGFLDPFAMVHLLSLSHSRSAGLTVRLPNPDICSYMERMNFFAAASGRISLEGAPAIHADTWSSLPSQILLEVTPICHGQDTRNLLPVVRDRMTRIMSSYGYDETDMHRFCTAVSELSQNIPRHSESIGWVTMQKFMLYDDAIKIAIGDAGVGVATTLAPKYATGQGSAWSDGVALQLATSEGVTRFDRTDCGHGLAITKQFVWNWEASMFIRSGTARWDMSPASGLDGQVTEGLPPCPGTQISITLPNRHRAQAADLQ